MQVLIDFSEHYHSVNAQALLQQWPAYETRLNEIKKKEYNANIYLQIWSDDICPFLVLLKVLQKSQWNRKKGNR